MIDCRECEGEGTVEYMCSYCNGSGEGMYDGSTCSSCRGSGMSDDTTCETCHGEGEVEDDYYE